MLDNNVETTLSEVIFSGNTPEISPIRGIRIVKGIEALGLPDIQADLTMLFGFYYVELGAEDAIKQMIADFGPDIADRIGMTFDRRGTMERPGIYAMSEKFDDHLEDYRDLREAVGRIHPTSYELIPV